MESFSQYSEWDRKYTAGVTADKYETVMCPDVKRIIADVHFNIAKEISDRIMDRLGPIIDQVLGEYEKKLTDLKKSGPPPQ